MPPVVFGNRSAFPAPRPGGSGGGGGPLPRGIGGGGEAPPKGSGGGGGGGGATEVPGGGGTGRAIVGRAGGGGAAAEGRGPGRGGGGGGPEDDAGTFGVFGGRGGGAALIGGIACAVELSLVVRGGGGGPEPRLGGGGGAPDGVRSPLKGGGTPNLCVGWSSSSIGVFGGLGGGGGPGFTTFDEARCLAGGAGAAVCANLPASAIGGGALNFNAGPPRGGDGVRSGDLGGDSDCCKFMFWLSGRFLRDGGGAGGGPLLDETVLTVFWELSEFNLPGAAEEGGGGGGA